MTQHQLLALIDKMLFLYPKLQGCVYTTEKTRSGDLFLDITTDDSQLLEAVKTTLVLAGLTLTVREGDFSLVDDRNLLEFISVDGPYVDCINFTIIEADSPFIQVRVPYISGNIS